MKGSHWIFVLLIGAMNFCSCTLFESGNELPEFLYAKEANLQTSAAEGANTHRIDNIWVFSDGKSLGVYELPSQIPVISESEVSNLLFLAGVRINGISSDAGIYPFYEGIELNRALNPGNTDTLQLNYHYKSGSIFALLEGFESSHLFQVDRDGDPGSSMVSTDEDFSTGNHSGLIEVSADSPLVEVASTITIDAADVQGKSLFLEIDYKNETEVRIGLVGIQGIDSFESLKLALRPREDWNKVYIDFAPDISSSQLDQYKVLFSVQFTGDAGETQKVYIDNVKLIHF